MLFCSLNNSSLAAAAFSAREESSGSVRGGVACVWGGSGSHGDRCRGKGQSGPCGRLLGQGALFVCFLFHVFIVVLFRKLIPALTLPLPWQINEKDKACASKQTLHCKCTLLTTALVTLPSCTGIIQPWTQTAPGSATSTYRRYLIDSLQLNNSWTSLWSVVFVWPWLCKPGSNR